MNENYREIEHALVSRVYYNPRVIDKLSIVANDFRDPRWKRVFRAVKTLVDKGIVDKEVDDVALRNMDNEISFTDLEALQDYPPTNIGYYEKIMIDMSMKRGLERLSAQIMDALSEGRDGKVVVEEIQDTLYRLVERKESDLKTISEFVHGAVDEIEALYHANGGIVGVTSGYSDIDHLTSGFSKGDLIIIGARTSIGKTALAVNMAVRTAQKGTQVGFFECEMSGTQTVRRVFSQMGGIQHHKIRSGLMGPSDFEKMDAVAERVFALPIYLDDTPNIPFDDLRSKARLMVRKGVEIIFIDYLALVGYRGPKNMPTFERIGALVAEIKQMARELNIPVVLVSQLNRQAEGETPSISHLSQSDQIAMHSDVIMLLHRYRDTTNDTHSQLFVAKNRNGPTGKVDLIYLPDTVSFEQRSKDV